MSTSTGSDLGPWEGLRAVVAGFGGAGFAAADNLTHLGAAVTALDEDPGDDARAEQAELLEVLGATVRLGPGSTAALPDDVDLVVASPDWDGTEPLLVAARERGVPVWGEVELAWRLRDPERAAPWLVVTGAPGVGADPGTTALMVEAVLRAEGRSAVVAGAAGLPLVEVVMDPAPYDAVVVALTPEQLREPTPMSASAAAVLAVGDADETTRQRLGRVFEQVQRACVFNLADQATEDLVREAEVVEGARAIAFTHGIPAMGELGLVEDILVDRAFIEARRTSAAELLTLAELPGEGAAVLDAALAAAALARAHGVSQAAVRDGLRGFGRA